MNETFYGPLFKSCRKLARIFYPPYKTEQTKLPKGPVVYVGHHQNLFGPFIMYHSFPAAFHCWILHVFLDKAACYDHYRNYTLTKRFGWNKWIASALAFLLSHFIPSLLHSGKGIPVYRGMRQVIKTLQKSVAVLKEGNSIAVFPTIDYQSEDDTIGDMYEGFLSIEKYYFKETGKHLSFVPIHISKANKTIIVGEAISFTGAHSFTKERKIVVEKLQQAINDMSKNDE